MIIRNGQYATLAARLEEALINHEVRGEKILNDMPDSDDPFVEFDSEVPKNCGAIGDHLKKKAAFTEEDFYRPYGMC